MACSTATIEPGRERSDMERRSFMEEKISLLCIFESSKKILSTLME